MMITPGIAEEKL